MIVGYEWLVDAVDCDKNALRDVETLRGCFARIISDLQLKTIGDGTWHKFDGEGGVTGLVMLTESHLACHTYPEHGTATFNLYCCRERPEWDWEKNLQEILGAEKVVIERLERGKTGNRKLVNFGEVSIRERGRLPHWEKEDGIYFVTFRLADSLPQNILEKLKAERDETEKFLSSLERELSFTEKQKIDKIFSEKVDEYLDQNYGECHLQKTEIAKIVADAIKHFDGERYHLYAWCIMPNHVHLVFRTINRHKLEDILHSWKSYTAHEINKVLQKEGQFWQREYYDHLVRDQKEFENMIQYTLNNPIKANLKNWQWVWAFEKYKTVAKT
jgi:S-adenosylmethionine decarboxylase proenzyme